MQISLTLHQLEQLNAPVANSNPINFKYRDLDK